MHSYIYDENEASSDGIMRNLSEAGCDDNSNQHKKPSPSYEQPQADFTNPMYFLNIYSSVNPLTIKLPPPLQEIDTPVYLDLISVRVPLSVLTVKDYLPLTPEESLQIQNDLEGDISELEHKLRSGVVDRIKSTAYDILSLRVKNYKNSDVFNENGELVTDPGVTLIPKVVSECSISCLEGDFINHKILYGLDTNGQDLFSEVKVFRNNGVKTLNLSIEYINGGLVEITKNYSIVARLTTTATTTTGN